MRGFLTARRLAVIMFCALCLVVACALAWWQWQRYESVGGTAQNLGYVLQWPLFGLFPAFMVWRMRRLRAGQQQANRSAISPSPRAAILPAEVGGPSESDDELAAYNRYLATLNAQDQHKQEKP